MKSKLTFCSLVLIGFLALTMTPINSASAISLRTSCVTKVMLAHRKKLNACVRLGRNKKAKKACYAAASKYKAAGLKRCAKTKK